VRVESRPKLRRGRPGRKHAGRSRRNETRSCAPWFDGKTDEEVSAYLASESFDRLSDRQQAVIHGVLDEIRVGNEAEVDIALEEADEESFEFPEAQSTDEDDSFFWLDEGDDDETGGEMDIAYR
jgi:hypothetical protein